jgi:hypothetical protein
MSAEAKVSENLGESFTPTVESNRNTFRLLGTQKEGFERDLRVSSPVLPSTPGGLGPLAAKSETFAQSDIPVNQHQHADQPQTTSGSAPAAARTPHFDFTLAETIEDNQNG